MDGRQLESEDSCTLSAMEKASETWRSIAKAQGGLITRRQLTQAGLAPHAVLHRVRSEKWQFAGPKVIATFTGELTHEQRLWLGVLHGGEESLIAGVHAATLGGLRNWDRDVITVLVPYSRNLPRRLEGYRFVRSKRDLPNLQSTEIDVPTCRPRAAVLLFAAEERSERSALGILAATIQQRLATAPELLTELEALGRIRRAPVMRRALEEFGGGIQSVSELDVARLCKKFGITEPLRQVKRRDADGRVRFTDCEWPLSDGRILVLEVDGAFHMEVEQWEDDLARQRALSADGRVIIRCTSRELRDTPEVIARDLKRLGVPLAA
ncbi:endonuclease domain-containing protein [Nocardioides sp. Kera G14]|uniref:endonuclease domain-containing protein n=1 Tax=Nocardioides sp. Kera G14 TaxID=2884264 RepID=UPI001D12C405|nr:endonuclease domain-containing protein [Nocardioides sp. Kera G14]UDY23077.1 endonuclease domain-containing protein [Nocardioides sp. Kera G14]